MPDTPTVLAILDDLVAIPSVPGERNEDWLRYVSKRLSEGGCDVRLVPSPGGDCSGLIASIGPNVPGGLVLSGHVDVVSAEGQGWTGDPFRLRQKQGRVYGRGVADMKGFVACAIATIEEATHRPLVKPVHIALSADEETKCQSALSLADFVSKQLPTPRGVLVGEPTLLCPVNRHRGSYTYKVDVIGRAAHASLPNHGVSATALAARLMTWIEDHSADGYPNGGTTHSIGVIEGGSASNIIAGQCWFEWDIRLAPGDRIDQIEKAFLAEVARLLAGVKERAPEVGVSLRQTACFPGFRTPPDHPFAQECLACSEAVDHEEFAAGTEAGIYAAANLPVMVMGPGDIAQAHITDEFLDIEQLERCLAQLQRFL